MTTANIIANAINMPVCNGLLLIAVNAFAANSDAAAVAVAMRLGAGFKFKSGDEDSMNDEYAI